MEEYSHPQQIETLLRKMLSEKTPFVLLHQIKGMIDRELDSHLQRECQITLAQFRVLAYLYHNMLNDERVPLSELAEILKVTKGNITGLIDRLKAQRYVRRVRDRNDRRRIFVEITPEGSIKLETAISHFENFMQRLMDSVFTKEEIIQFHGLLKKFNEKLPSALSEIKNQLKNLQHQKGVKPCT